MGINVITVGLCHGFAASVVATAAADVRRWWVGNTDIGLCKRRRYPNRRLDVGTGLV